MLNQHFLKTSNVNWLLIQQSPEKVVSFTQQDETKLHHTECKQLASQNANAIQVVYQLRILQGRKVPSFEQICTHFGHPTARGKGWLMHGQLIGILPGHPTLLDQQPSLKMGCCLTDTHLRGWAWQNPKERRRMDSQQSLSLALLAI